MSDEKPFKSIDQLANRQENQLKYDHELAEFVFQASPLVAWVLLMACLGVAMMFGSLIAQDAPVRGLQTAAAVVYLGWFVLFYYAHEPHLSIDSRLRHFVALLFVVAIGAQFAFTALFPTLGSYEAPSVLLETTLWTLGFFSPLAVVLLSSRLLVKIENEGAIKLDQFIGTFLAMFLLPIGIILLQPRIRQLRTT